MAERSTRLAPGSRIGPYEVISQLGQGGMATVYKAYQSSLDRQVAIKVMADRYASDPTFVERFRREARSIARLHHPNILTVYDAGEDDGLLYMVMEFIEGETLREEMIGQPLSFERCGRVLDQVAAALNYANQKGIVHRDVKPSNVLLDKNNDRAVLSDFGIAKLLDGTGANLTATNEGMGTPEYMSPEQALGEGLDARSDEYSLAAMAFEMLTGKPPYNGDTPIAVVMGHVSKEIPTLRNFNGQVSPGVESVIRRGLAKKPADRYESVAGFNTALQEALKNNNAAVATTQAVDVRPQSSQPYTPADWQNQGSQAYGAPQVYIGPNAQPYGTPPQSQPYNPPGYGTPPQPQPYGTPPQSQQFSGPYTNQNSGGYPGAYPYNQPAIAPAKKGAPVGLLAGIGAIVVIAIVAVILLVALGGGKKDATPTAQAIVASPTVNATSPAAPTTSGPATTAPDSTTAAPVTTASPTTVAPTTAPPPNGNSLTKGGFPVETSLKEIKTDAATLKTLTDSLGQAGQGANLYLYTTATPIDQLVTFYKGNPSGWTTITNQTQADTTALFMLKDGKGGLFLAAPITQSFIDSAGTPAPLRPSLKVGDNFVMLADNIDIAALGNTTKSVTNGATTKAASGSNANVPFKSFKGISGVWEAEIPDGWTLSSDTSKYSLTDRFSQPDDVIDLEVTLSKNDYATDSAAFDKAVVDDTTGDYYSEVKRDRKKVGNYDGWLVSGKYKTSKGQYPFQYLFLNRKDSILEVKQQMQSDLGEPFQGVLSHVADTLKINDTKPIFPSAEATPDGKTDYAKYTSPSGGWNGQVPQGWGYYSYIGKSSVSETWELDDVVSLEVQINKGYDPSGGDAAKLKKSAQDSAQIRKMTDAKFEDKKVGNHPAVLVTGKKPDYEGKSYSYAFLLVSAGNDSYYEVSVTVSKATGEPYFQAAVDKMLGSFQIS